MEKVLHSLHVGDRIFGPRRQDGRIPSAAISALLVDEHDHFFALVPRVVLGRGRDPLFLDIDGKHVLSEPGSGDIRILPGQGAFAAVRVANITNLFGPRRDYTSATPGILDEVSVGGNPGRVTAFLSQLTVAQGYSETGVYLVEIPGELSPVVGDPLYTEKGIAGLVFGFSEASRKAAVVPFVHLFDRFQGLRLRVANIADLETHNLALSNTVPIPSFQFFLEWMEGQMGLDGGAQVPPHIRSPEEILELINLLPTAMDYYARTTLSPSLGQGASTLDEILTHSELLNAIRFDPQNFTFYMAVDGTTSDHPAFPSLVRAAFQLAAKEAAAA